LTGREPLVREVDEVEIGRPKRIIEIEPASLPMPETLPLPVTPEPVAPPAAPVEKPSR
jgi:hypothetical protein